MRKKIRMFGTGLFIIIILLTFFSKTVYNYNLPTVTGALPGNGTLKKTETATGVVKWAEVEDIYSEISGKVDSIFVKEGDKVTKGQALVKLSFDEDETNLKVKQLEIDRTKSSADIESTKSKIDKLKKSIGDNGGDGAFDAELAAVKNKIAKAEENLEKQNDLYKSGMLTRKELEDAELELSSLNNEYESLKRKKKEELEALQQELKTKSLDAEKLELQQKSLQKTLAALNKTTVYAPFDGTITKLTVKKGQQANPNEMIASIGQGSAFEIECQINAKNNFIAVGDTAKVTNGDHELEGTVDRIKPDETGKKLSIKLSSNEISEGESFKITFEKTSKSSHILVPNSAVNKDKDGYFLYALKTREGILGKEFYVEKLRVEVGDADSQNTIITKGALFFEPIVITSDKQFEEGAVVKIKNEGDLFVK